MQQARHPTAPGPKPRPHNTTPTVYDRAVTHVRRCGRTDTLSLAQALGISEWHAQSLAKRMYEAGVVSSVDLFGNMRCREVPHD